MSAQAKASGQGGSNHTNPEIKEKCISLAASGQDGGKHANPEIKAKASGQDGGKHANPEIKAKARGQDCGKHANPEMKAKHICFATSGQSTSSADDANQAIPVKNETPISLSTSGQSTSSADDANQAIPEKNETPISLSVSCDELNFGRVEEMVRSFLEMEKIFSSIVLVLETAPEIIDRKEILLQKMQNIEEEYEKQISVFKHKAMPILTGGLLDELQVLRRRNYSRYIKDLDEELLNIKLKRNELVQIFSAECNLNHSADNSLSDHHQRLVNPQSPVKPGCSNQMIPVKKRKLTSLGVNPQSPLEPGSSNQVIPAKKSKLTSLGVNPQSPLEPGSSNQVIPEKSKLTSLGVNPQSPLEPGSSNQVIPEKSKLTSLGVNPQSPLEPGSSNQVIPEKSKLTSLGVNPQSPLEPGSSNQVIPVKKSKLTSLDVNLQSPLKPGSSNQVNPQSPLEPGSSNQVIPVMKSKLTSIGDWPTFDDLISEDGDGKTTIAANDMNSSKHEAYSYLPLDNEDINTDRYIVDSLITEIGSVLDSSVSEEGQENLKEFDTVSTLLDEGVVPCNDTVGPTLVEEKCCQQQTQKSYVCSECSETFQSIEILVSHKRLIHLPQICANCAEVFDDFESFSQHVGDSHKSYRLCFECFVVVEDEQFSKHEATHKKETPEHNDFKCRVCSKAFKTLDRLDLHETRHKKSFHACDLCGKLFLSRFELQKHRSEHEMFREKSICELCYLCFDSLMGLVRHIKFVHQTHRNEFPKSFACIICRKDFRNTETLIDHLRFFHETNSWVRRAASGYQTGATRNQCAYCDLFFRSSKVRTVHVLLAHGQPPYLCKCGVAFFVKAMLDVHELQHTKKEETRYARLSRSWRALSFTKSARDDNF